MQCEKFEQRLHQWLDERRRPELDEALVEHASVCARCSELLSGQEALLDGLDLSILPEPPALLTQRVLAEVVPQRAPRPRAVGEWQRRLLGVAVAASLLVATAALIYNSGSPENGSPENGSPENGSPENGSPENGGPENRVPVQPLANDTPSPKGIVPTAPNTGTFQQENLVLLAKDRVLTLWEKTGVSQEAPVWLDPMARPLIPVRDTVTAVLHALRNTVSQPVDPEQTRSS